MRLLKQGSTEMPSALFYLALSQSKRFPYLSARITANRPSLRPDEVLLELSVDVPAAMFARPHLRATVKVHGDTPAPVITTEIQDGIAAAVQAQLGLRVHVTAEPEMEA
jgi:hypothetical protein